MSNTVGPLDLAGRIWRTCAIQVTKGFLSRVDVFRDVAPRTNT